MNRPTFSLQPLEARRFLSASPAHLAECPEVVEARQEVQETTVELRHDRYAGRQALAAIRAEIVEELRVMHEENGEAIAEAVAPLRRALAAAVRAQGAARREVLDELQAVRDAWQPILQADIRAVLDARAAGDADALAAATQKIEADRAALYAELNPLKQKLVGVTKETSAAIQDARTAVEDKLAEFSPTLKSLLEELRTKAKEVEQTLISGHNAVVAAQQALREAIAECREAHAGEHALA